MQNIKQIVSPESFSLRVQWADMQGFDLFACLAAWYKLASNKYCKERVIKAFTLGWISIFPGSLSIHYTV